jgi:hypothetical protein
MELWKQRVIEIVFEFVERVFCLFVCLFVYEAKVLKFSSW